MNPNFQTVIAVVPAMGLLKGDRIPVKDIGGYVMREIVIGPSRRSMPTGRMMVDVTIAYGETFVTTILRPEQRFTVTRVG